MITVEPKSEEIVEPKSEETVEPKKTTEIVETSEIIEEQNGQMVEEPKSEETVEPISDVSAEPKESTEIIEICEHVEEENNPNENIETNNDMEQIYAEQKEQIVENVDETMNEPKLEDIPEISSNESKKKKKNKHKK